MPDTVSPLRSVAPCGGAAPTRISRDVAKQQRGAAVRGSTMLPKSPALVARARAAQRVLLGGMLDVPAAEVGVVLPDAHRDVVQRQPVLRQKRRVDVDLELPGLAAPRVDLADAGNGAQLLLDHPLVKVLQFHRAHRTAAACTDRARRTRSPAVRASAARLAAAATRLLQPLVDQLPGEVHRHGVVEDDGDHRQAELRDRPHFFACRAGRSSRARSDR